MADTKAEIKKIVQDWATKTLKECEEFHKGGAFDPVTCSQEINDLLLLKGDDPYYIPLRLQATLLQCYKWCVELKKLATTFMPQRLKTILDDANWTE